LYSRFRQSGQLAQLSRFPAPGLLKKMFVSLHNSLGVCCKPVLSPLFEFFQAVVGLSQSKFFLKKESDVSQLVFLKLFSIHVSTTSTTTTNLPLRVIGVKDVRPCG
jgi:hypothetical protein